MRSDALDRLRRTMRGGNSSIPIRTVGTLEPAPVPTKSSSPFQSPFQSNGDERANKNNDVPTVPTVPTNFEKGKKVKAKEPVLTLEPALEPERNGQNEADLRNEAAVLAGHSDRWCACGTMATVAVGRFPKSAGNPEGVTAWLCCECFELYRSDEKEGSE